MQPKYQIASQVHLVNPIRQAGELLIEVDGHALRATLIRRGPNECLLRVNGVERTVYFAQDDKQLFVHVDGRVIRLHAIDEFGDSRGGDAETDSLALAPMPGVVIAVEVSPGQRVTPGATLMLIESMKLQSEIKAKIGGRVSRIAVSAGASFERNAILVEIDPDAARVAS